MAVISMREAISQALWEEMERDERVFILGEEVGVWGGTYAVTKGFSDRFGPERVRDTPIAEGVIIGAANGAAMAGLKPVAELMTINFAFMAMDQIVNHSAKLLSMVRQPVHRASSSSAPSAAAHASSALRIRRLPMSSSPTSPA